MKKKIKSIFEMRHFLKKAGKIPGELEVEETTRGPAVIGEIRYNSATFESNQPEASAGVLPDTNTSWCHWIDLIGLGDIQTIQQLGKNFALHPLTLEDIINTDHLPKCEISGEQLFFTLKFPLYHQESDTLELRHISLILTGPNLLSMQEGNQDLLIPIKERIRQDRGRIRKGNTEYLLYALIDYIIDQYFFIMDTLGDDIERTEDMLIDDPETNHIQKIHRIKKRIVYLRKYLTSLTKAVSQLQGNEVQFADANIKVYFRDIYDHMLHINEALVTSKDLQTTLLEMNMSNVNNSMNRVMKTLTVVATIFIPLTFMVGIYGMNFQYMPELNWKYGYPAVMALMLVIAAIMIWWIKRKNWI
ncbi:MAG: magnesium/cobalt transporter CorA [Bacteroidales bacterium]|nr:magnesium/cobalt transporter CorA [Bacteroidales bacterium]